MILLARISSYWHVDSRKLVISSSAISLACRRYRVKRLHECAEIRMQVACETLVRCRCPHCFTATLHALALSCTHPAVPVVPSVLCIIAAPQRRIQSAFLCNLHFLPYSEGARLMSICITENRKNNQLLTARSFQSRSPLDRHTMPYLPA